MTLADLIRECAAEMPGAPAASVLSMVQSRTNQPITLDRVEAVLFPEPATKPKAKPKAKRSKASDS